MKNFKALLGLDVKLCLPYWKWWAMFFGLALFMGIMNQDGGLFILFIAMFGMTLMAYPFELAEKSNLDVLYASLPSNRNSMLVARYSFMALSLLAMMLVAIPVGLIITVAFGNTINATAFAIITALSIGIYLICVAVQTPFMYKHGYRKGRIFMWIPITIAIVVFNLPVLFDLFNLNIEFNIFEILFRNATASILVSLGVGIASFIASFFLAQKLYLKKDF